jgi:hypothetical protein
MGAGCRGDDEVNDEQIEEIKLERLRYFVQMNVDAGAASEFGIKPEVRATQLASFVSDSILFQLRQDIFGRTLDEIKFPANWKEAVKERFAPRWFLKRWPVRYTIYKIDELYPKMPAPRYERALKVSIISS